MLTKFFCGHLHSLDGVYDGYGTNHVVLTSVHAVDWCQVGTLSSNAFSTTSRVNYVHLSHSLFRF